MSRTSYAPPLYMMSYEAAVRMKSAHLRMHMRALGHTGPSVADSLCIEPLRARFDDTRTLSHVHWPRVLELLRPHVALSRERLAHAMLDRFAVAAATGCDITSGDATCICYVYEALLQTQMHEDTRELLAMLV